MQAFFRAISFMVLVVGVVMAPGGSACFASCFDAVALCSPADCAAGSAETDGFLPGVYPECAGVDADCDGDCLCGSSCEAEIDATGSGGNVRVKDAPVMVVLIPAALELGLDLLCTHGLRAPVRMDSPQVATVGLLRSIVLLV